MVKRGMAIGEKRARMLAILHGSADTEPMPYTLKQLEKLGSKQKIVTQSIKDVLQLLVDDNEAELEKIGSTNYYWSFPSKSLAKAQSAIVRLGSEKAAADKKFAELEAEQKALLAERVPCAERTKSLQEFEAAKRRAIDLEAELAMYKENDPALLCEIEKEVRMAKEAAERWTDNIWAMLDHIRKKYGCDKQQAYQALQINDKFDYPEYKPKKKKKRR